MRVVDRKTFLALPAGTIYCKGVRYLFDGTRIKGESLTNDWFYLDMAWPSASSFDEATTAIYQSLRSGNSFPCQDLLERDGLFDDDAVFLIFERDDLLALRSRIDAALSLAEPA